MQLRQQAYQYELMPDGRQVRLMAQFSGCCRYVYNKALALQQERYKAGQKHLRYVELAKLLTAWRHDPDTIWLSAAPIHPLQHSLKNLDAAYTNFFTKRTSFPKNKIRGRHDSFRYPDTKQIKLDQANNRIFLPKLGWMRYRNSRVALGDIRNVTVSRRYGKWFISVQTQREMEKVVHPSTSATGIDLGIKRFATFSDGDFITPLSAFKCLETALRRANQALSRKKKYSKNWKKVLRKVQRLHAKIRNTRQDFLHKITTTISKNHAIVCLEDLQIVNMSASAKGSLEEPGRNVKAKSGLNKAILDQGWGEFNRQLAYKMEWSGGTLIRVPAHYTSQTCPECECVTHANRPSQAVFCCIQCGYADNADAVAATNILRAGLARIACEVNREVSGQQQEPAEVIDLRAMPPANTVGIVRL